jgi:hypothetical protein
MVFPSAAAPLLGGPSDDLGGGVDLLPAADSEYATVGADGELALDLTPGEAGLNPDSVTVFADVFYVRYAGDRYAEVWLSARSESVAFSVDGQPTGSPAERVTVEPGEVLPVSVRVDTTTTTTTGDGALDVDTVTVYSRVAESPGGGEEEDDEADSEVATTEASVPAVQRIGPTADGSVSFTLMSSAAGESVTLDAGSMLVAGEPDRGAALSSLSVTPASGDLTALDVDRVSPTAPGSLPDGAAADALGAIRVAASGDVDEATFRLTVDDALVEDAAVDDAGDLVFYRQSDGEWREVSLSVVADGEGSAVVEGTTPGFSTFVLAAERLAIGVSEASVAPATVSANDSATVTATVRNDGGAAGERSVAVTVGGRIVAERSVSLDAGEATTITASVAPELGEHAVSVGDVDAGTLVVAADGGDAGGADASDSSEASEAGDGGQGAAATDPDDPQAEPAGFDFATLAGAGVAVALAVVGVGLVRRWRGGGE